MTASRPAGAPPTRVGIERPNDDDFDDNFRNIWRVPRLLLSDGLLLYLLLFVVRRLSLLALIMMNPTDIWVADGAS